MKQKGKQREPPAKKVKLSLRLTPEQHRLMLQKVQQAGMCSAEAYLRKMAIDGLVVRLELPELKQMLSLLRYLSNNLNQLAKRANQGGKIYAEDIKEVLRRQDELWQAANLILRTLARL